MKKVIAIALALIFIIALSACDDNSETKSSEPEKTASENSAEGKDVDNDSETAVESGSYATENIEEFVDIVNSTLDMSGYELEEDDDGYWVKAVKTGDKEKPETSITIDGYKVDLPVKYNDLIDAGWTDTKGIADETLDKSSITSTTFTTSSGKSVAIYFANDGEETKAIKDLPGVKLILTNASTDSAASIDPPSFTLFGSISNNTDLKGILKANSNPNYVDIVDSEESNTAVTSTIKYSDDEDSVEISYYYTNKTILSITMESGIANSITTY